MQGREVTTPTVIVRTSRERGRLTQDPVEEPATLPVCRIESAFAARASARVQALAARTRTPTLYGATGLVRVGGLMGYGVNLREMYRHGASFVDRISKGARALGLTIPPSLLLRADQVLE